MWLIAKARDRGASRKPAMRRPARCRAGGRAQRCRLYLCRAMWLRKQRQIGGSRRADADRRAERPERSWSISTNGGSSAACWSASCSTRARPRPPTARARLPGAAEGQLPRRPALHRRVDRVALPERSGDRAGAFRARSTKARVNPHALSRARLLAGPRRRGDGTGERSAAALRDGREHSATYYGQLARARLGLPDIGLRDRRNSRRRTRGAEQPRRSCAPSKSFMPSTNAT